MLIKEEIQDQLPSGDAGKQVQKNLDEQKKANDPLITGSAGEEKEIPKRKRTIREILLDEFPADLLNRDVLSDILKQPLLGFRAGLSVEPSSFR